MTSDKLAHTHTQTLKKNYLYHLKRPLHEQHLEVKGVEWEEGAGCNKTNNGPH